MTQLGPDFTLEEMPCYEKASSSDVAKLRDTVTYVLQPIRNAFGPVIVTSWRWWKANCRARTGPHSGGGTVDFVTPNADLRTVFAWGYLHLPRTFVGRWIYEPSIPGPGGVLEQGEHVHVASRQDMRDVDGITDSAAYVMTSAGTYTPVAGWAGNNQGESTISVEGLQVATAGVTLEPWAIGAVALVIGLGLYDRYGKGK